MSSTRYSRRLAVERFNAGAKFAAWLAEQGIVAPALVLGRWVRAQAPGKGTRNRSLAIKQTPDAVLVKNHATGEPVIVFSDDRDGPPVDHASLARRRRQAEAETACCIPH